MCKEIYKESVQTICPHCYREIKMVWVCKVESIIGTRYIYFCSECQKKLGMSRQEPFEVSITESVIKADKGVVGNLY